MKKIIIINEDGSREELPGIIGYGLAAVTDKEVYRRMEVECNGMNVLVLAGSLEVVAEEMAETAGFEKNELENMMKAINICESRKDSGDDE